MKPHSAVGNSIEHWQQALPVTVVQHSIRVCFNRCSSSSTATCCCPGLRCPVAAPSRYACPITVTGYSQAADGSITEVQAEADLEFQAGSGKKPPKGVLNWVAQPTPGQDPERAEVRC